MCSTDKILRVCVCVWPNFEANFAGFDLTFQAKSTIKKSKIGPNQNPIELPTLTACDELQTTKRKRVYESNVNLRKRRKSRFDSKSRANIERLATRERETSQDWSKRFRDQFAFVGKKREIKNLPFATSFELASLRNVPSHQAVFLLACLLGSFCGRQTSPS